MLNAMQERHGLQYREYEPIVHVDLHHIRSSDSIPSTHSRQFRLAKKKRQRVSLNFFLFDMASIGLPSRSRLFNPPSLAHPKPL